jgi:5'(3')-deoxyribonucleotidase
MNLTIGIDMDNTITDFNKQFIKYVKALGYELDKEKMFNTWYLEDAILGLSQEQKVALVDEILFIDEFWLTMEPMTYAVEFIQWLNNKYDVRIVTTPWRFNDKFYNTKLEWIQENMPYLNIHQVQFCKEKWKCNIDVIIDDKPDTLEKCMKSSIFTVAYDHPYNRDTKVDLRIECWKNLPVYVDQIIKNYF